MNYNPNVGSGDTQPTQGSGYLRYMSTKIVTTMENVAYRHGRRVASHPTVFIGSCVAFTALSTLGFLNFYSETRPEKLWIPQDSDFVRALEWGSVNFPNDQRTEMMLFAANNVLTPGVLKQMYRLNKQIENLTVVDEFGQMRKYEDMCFKVPSIVDSKSEDGREKSSTSDMRSYYEMISITDWSLVLNPDTYCMILDLIPDACLQLGILDMWPDEEEIIYSLTEQDIINTINTVNISSKYLQSMDFTKFLGDIHRNNSGHIVSAGATIQHWFMKVNRSDIDMSEVDGTAGMAVEVDKALYSWEGELIQFLLNSSQQLQNISLYFTTDRSFGDISGKTIEGDVTFLTVGVIILFIYVTLVLGRFSLVERRTFLSIMGMSSIAMAVTVAFGLCSSIRLPYSPVHNMLPLLLIGLGVDDMFVIAQCWDNLSQEEKERGDLVEMMGRTLKHAGVAITLTSLTDAVAFLIGSTTVLPALTSFCIYSAVGVVSLYFLQSTYFVAWFTLDQKRMRDNRDGLFWCYKLKSNKITECSRRENCRIFFLQYYNKVLLSKWGKIGTLVLTGILLSVCTWGISTLQQEFNIIWFLPQSSYLFQFFNKSIVYYPDAGVRGQVFLGSLNYPNELPKIAATIDQLIADPDISSVDCWYTKFVEYAYHFNGEDVKRKPLNETTFNNLMGKFIFSPSGARFQISLHFDGNITCGNPTPRILASKFDYQHNVLKGRDAQIDAMDRTKEIIANQVFSDFAVPVAMMYSSWETDKMITQELFRNLSLALIAVFVMTLILIVNFFTASYVFVCVTLTLIDVMALMSWWDLTVTTVSCINLVLCVGLCVDYAAHIGLHFMQVTGTRNERVNKTLEEIAPAVINGALSTFLALVPLANSDSYVFLNFFKIFFGVFVFGVFHGIVFLPVLLSLIGPRAYDYSKASPIGLHSTELVSEDIELHSKTKSRDFTERIYVPQEHAKSTHLECSSTTMPSASCLKEEEDARGGSSSW